MNIVFWLFIVIGLVWVWFMLSFLFNRLGGWFLDLFNDAKRDITKENNENEEE